MKGFVLWLMVFVWVAFSRFALHAGEESSYMGAGTRRMAQRLDELARAANPAEQRFMNSERVELFRTRAAKAANAEDKAIAYSEMCTELVNAGRTQEALAEFGKLEELLRQADLFQTNKLILRPLQALAHLRLGEQDNCLTNHTLESCLFPIQGGGIHKLQRGSRGAIAVLTQLLGEFPDDLASRWMLNIAYMTLGEYPEKVPNKWLIPPQRFASDYDLKPFIDVSPAVGLDLDGLAGGVILEDFDNDGFLDLMNSAWGARDQLRYFRNNGDGTFSERTQEAGLIGETGGLNMLQADYNNDGNIDFLILRGAWAGSEGRVPNSLIRNNGNGTFDDVTEEAGLLSFHPTQTATWFDYNGDGWLDLFIGNESKIKEIHPCELYRNNGNGTFTECAARAGLALLAFVKGVTSGDYNKDGRPDLYVSCLGRANLLFRNDGPRATTELDWKFTDVSRSARVQEPNYSFPTWFWDYDNDGWPDIFVAGYNIKDVGDIAADYLNLPHNGERARLYRNNGDGTFADVTKSAGLFKIIHAMGSNFGDVDNDGYLDIYAGTGNPDLSTLMPNRMFRNANGQFFQDVTTSARVGHLQKGHGVAFGDLDHDGDQDIYEDMGGAFTGDTYRNVLFENPGRGNNWIKLKLEGVRSNRSAIGAQIKIVVPGEKGDRTIYKTVNSGGSFGASPLRQEIGLGQAATIKSLEILWPGSGSQQSFANVAVNQCLRIREGDSAPVPVELRSFKFPSGKAAHHHPH
ncbi:MAG: CRTAC1 family protein [Verrucomicrobia bacterium]|nr:CRTAC1 family protein [Verrucomicrobiota bacterium]